MIFKPHTTVATIVEKDGRYLFVEERIRGRHVLNQPAGHLEPDEGLADAAVRETLEETGCRVRIDDLVGIYQWTAGDSGRQFLRFTFSATLLEVVHDAPLDHGIVRPLWLSREQLANSDLPLRAEVVLRSLDDYRDGQRHPLSLLRRVAS